MTKLTIDDKDEQYEAKYKHWLDVLTEIYSIVGADDAQCVERIKRLLDQEARHDEIASLLKEASGPMSYERWSSKFRQRVERALV